MNYNHHGATIYYLSFNSLSSIKKTKFARLKSVVYKDFDDDRNSLLGTKY